MMKGYDGQTPRVRRVFSLKSKLPHIKSGVSGICLFIASGRQKLHKKNIQIDTHAVSI